MLEISTDAEKMAPLDFSGFLPQSQLLYFPPPLSLSAAAQHAVVPLTSRHSAPPLVLSACRRSPYVRLLTRAPPSVGCVIEPRRGCHNTLVIGSGGNFDIIKLLVRSCASDFFLLCVLVGRISKVKTSSIFIRKSNKKKQLTGFLKLF